MSSSSSCDCPCSGSVDTRRRQVTQLAAAGLTAPILFSAVPAHSKPMPGDYLVEDDAEGPPKPLRVADLKPGKPMLAFPFDPKARAVRDDSRLSKIVLLRWAEGDMAPATRARAAGGVVAHSAVCTHQACDVKTWLSKEKVLVCFCHASKFQPLDGGAVVAGPATRALPTLPLTLEGELLVVAGAFSAAPGGTNA